MSSLVDWPARIDDFLLARIRAGDDGKSLLLGVRDHAPAFAVAAGLRGADDHPAFLTFARYLLHNRFGCDAYALMLPVEIGAQPRYLVELGIDGRLDAWLLDIDGQHVAHDSGEPAIGDLVQPGVALPGILRRDMDRLCEQLRVPVSTG